MMVMTALFQVARVHLICLEMENVIKNVIVQRVAYLIMAIAGLPLIAIALLISYGTEFAIGNVITLLAIMIMVLATFLVVRVLQNNQKTKHVNRNVIFQNAATMMPAGFQDAILVVMTYLTMEFVINNVIPKNVIGTTMSAPRLLIVRNVNLCTFQVAIMMYWKLIILNYSTFAANLSLFYLGLKLALTKISFKVLESFMRIMELIQEPITSDL